MAPLFIPPILISQIIVNSDLYILLPSVDGLGKKMYFL